ncbi:YhgE/Pip domain-containing protein [Lapidilactobacillus luobeiensis]|uniref:YhgE/Pip domain-containing protein n=1 Tax=Lapidilactobacillus luobeiensis TaxID=2950371 RepID=UPI0021C43CB3|nr:YhgE/Pip domain-containing protein [Lapidilactobacillus luobeiensis]
MVKDEFGFIKKNKLILLSVLVIMVIPFLYAIFFLKSVWDPYGSTQDLPVAVVNNDTAVKYNGTTLNVGQETEKKLRKNKELGWHFVSAKRAKQGMKDNKYYTVVTIPENFSANAATVLDEHPKKMQLKYETNDSLNYLSQVISGVGVSTLDKEIRANVTNAYASALFDQVKLVGKGMKKAAKGATQLNDGLVTLDDGVNQYTVGVSTVHDGIQTMSLKVKPLSSGVQQLATGANQLNSGLGTYISGTNQVASGLNTLNGKVGTLSSGVTSYTNGVGQLATGLQTMSGQTGTLESGITRLAQGSTNLNAGISQYVDGTDQLVAGLTPLITKLPDLLEQAGQVQAQLATAKASISKLSGVLQENQASVAKANVAFEQGEAAINAGLADPNLSQQSKAQIQGGLAAMKQSYNGLAQVRNGEAQATTQLLQGMSSMLTTIDTKFLSPANLAAVQKLAAQLPALNAGIAALKTNGVKLKAGASQLNTGLNSLNASVPALIAGVNQLNAGAQKLNANSATLNGGVGQLAAGVNQLNAGGQQLAANGGALTSGSSQLASGLTTLNGQIPTLTSGVSQLLAGTTQLTDKNGQLTSGATKLKSGSKTLSTSLGDGAKEVNGIKLSSETAEMFAAPTKTKHTYFSKVANYGHALAPYVLSLALYVGALVFNFAYPIRKVSKKDGTATQWFFSKITIGAVVATGMALVEATLIMAFGLQVDHVGLFYLIAWLFAMASMYLIMFLSMWLDNPGRFFAMILLMLQLGGAGGTFPMQITNHFYNVIHPFLPMSYSIMGFRQAITSGINRGTVNFSIFFLILVSVIFLALLWLVMNHLQKKHLMGVSQLDDNQKLQEVEH